MLRLQIKKTYYSYIDLSENEAFSRLGIAPSCGPLDHVIEQLDQSDMEQILKNEEFQDEGSLELWAIDSYGPDGYLETLFEEGHWLSEEEEEE